MNRKRLTELMTQHDLGAVVGTSVQSLVYAFGYEVFEGILNQFGQAVVIPRDSQVPAIAVLPTLEVGYAIDAGLDRETRVQLFGQQSKEAMPSIWEGRYDALMAHVQPSIVDAIAAALDEAGVHGQVAVDSNGHPSAAELAARINSCEFADHGEDIIYLARLVKTPAEIEKLRRAQVINESAMQAVVVAAGDYTVVDAGSIFVKIVTEGGGIPLHFLLHEGGAFRHWGYGGRRMVAGIPGRADKPIERGRRYSYDAGLLYQGYVSDLGGTFLLGCDPSEDDTRIYRALSAGIEAGLQEIRPGMRASELKAKVESAVRKNGMPDLPPRNMVGHFIGLDHLEGWIGDPVSTHSPFLPNPFDVEFEENMVLNFELFLADPGQTGYQYELAAAVTKSGAAPISALRALQVIA